MLIRITLIIAILGGLAVGVLNFVQVKDKITTTLADRDQFHKERDDQERQKKQALKDLATTKTTLDKTTAQLKETTAEREAALQKADEESKRAQALDDTLKKTKDERDSAQNELAAWRALGVPLERIKATLASLKAVTEERDAIAAEKKVLIKANFVLQEKINSILNPDYEVKLPEGLKGKVLVSDPRYDFVVLDIGQNQGVLEAGRLLVNHNGKLVAKVQIKSVQADRSIANVMPGWQISDIMEGDQVLY
jgi:myosin heavy subunit